VRRIKSPCALKAPKSPFLGRRAEQHILKPAVAHFEGVVFNEALCMKLAVAAGLPAASVETRTVDGMEYLLVERYDRTHRR